MSNRGDKEGMAVQPPNMLNKLRDASLTNKHNNHFLLPELALASFMYLI